MTTDHSWIPLILIIGPVFGAIVIELLAAAKKIRAVENIAIGFLCLQFAISLPFSIRIWSGTPLLLEAYALRIDGLSALMGLLINMMVLLILIYSKRYMQREQEHGLVSIKRYRLYYTLILIFTGSMNWTVTTNHLIHLYVAMEASTLATALLVAFYRKKASLEAGYKYVLLVVVGMTFSLLGMVLIFAAVYPHLGADGLLLSRIGEVVKLIPRNIALFGVAFMTCGFACKAGLVPFHAWLPDAHSEAPSPVSALLSGLIIKLGAYALTRTVTIFAPTYHGIVIFIALLASASMLIGIMMALVQDDLKRMLAYSSVSQISYVFEGLGLGTYLGIYGGLFHLVNHTLIKALLFLSVGAIMYATGGVRRISQLGGLGKKMPVTAFCFLAGALAIGGLPPFNGFVSKFTLFMAIGEQHLYWAVAISILTGLMTLACLVRAGYLVFWAKPSQDKGVAGTPIREVPASMYAVLLLLAALCLVIGLFPNLLYPILDNATRAVLAIWSAGG